MPLSPKGEIEEIEANEMNYVHYDYFWGQL
jgi:hypothetical protein